MITTLIARRVQELAQAASTARLLAVQGRLKLISVALVALIIVLRAGDRFWRPQLWAEDGAIFFRDAYELSFWQSISKTYAGYYHTLPRIVAEFALVFPLELTPTIYVLSALIAAAFCCSFFLLDHFAWLMPQLHYRALFCLILAALPSNDEIMLRFVNMQWYLGVLAFLLLLIRMPGGWAGRGLYVIGWGIIAVTVPQAIIFAPCLLIKAILVKDERAPLLAAFATLSGLLAPVLIGSILSQPERSTGGSASSILPGLWNALIQRVLVAGTLGYERTLAWFFNRPARAPFLYLWLIPFALIAATFAWTAIRRQPRVQQLVWLFLGYCIAAPVLLAIVGRAAMLNMAQTINGIWGTERYFVLPIAAMYLSFVWWISSMPHTGRLAPGKIALLALIVSAVSSDFSVSPDRDMQWNLQVQRIRAAEAQEGEVTLSIPINPQDWAIPLNVPGSVVLDKDVITTVAQAAPGSFDSAQLPASPVEQELVRATGWAGNPTSSGVAQEVLIVDRGTRHVIARARPMIERSDVAAEAARPDWRFSGWEAVFTIDRLGPGTHTLQAYALDPAHKRAYQLGNAQTILVE